MLEIVLKYLSKIKQLEPLVSITFMEGQRLFVNQELDGRYILV